MGNDLLVEQELRCRLPNIKCDFIIGRWSGKSEMRIGQMAVIFTLLLCAAAFMPSVRSEAAAEAGQAVWETRSGRQVSEAAMLDQMAHADLVFVGEQHDDPATHRLELRLLQGLHARLGSRLTLGMEMWERDEQSALDAYSAGTTTEAMFLKSSRPWPNYQTDYRPLVEYAKAQHIPVAATNAPQAIVSAVGKTGLTALASAPPDQVASLIQAPHDDYWQRFQATMQAMGGAHGGMTMDDATIQRFYEAQVVRDETMAESIVNRLGTSSGDDPSPVVLHINGQFHSDNGGGIPKRVLWRRPMTRIVIVSVIPVDHLPASLTPEQRRLADYVIFVPAPSGHNSAAQ
jgi:uncharacterized iron-regulated protein